MLGCSKTKWHGREAFVLVNDLVHLVTLTGGGHIAEFRFRERKGLSTLNPLWVPPWKTIEPYHYRPGQHAARYGSPATGRTLSGITGHNLCLDFFGSPSEEEARQGLSIHGEKGRQIISFIGRSMSRLVRHSSTPRRVAFAYRHSRGEPILMVTKAKNCFDPRAILNGHVPRICKETSLILHNPSSVPGRDLWQRLCSIRGGRSDISQH